MKNGGWARNHSPLASQWEPRVGGGGLSHGSPIHVTTPHYPTHAGRDARGPQNSTCPPTSGLTGRGGSSSWERRRPRRPMVIFIATAWNEKRRVGTESLPLASRREARVGGGGLSHGSPIHVTTPHYPTHAGRDARGPQIRAGPPISGLTGLGGASSWERRRPRRPIAIAWNEERRVGTESLPSPVAMGATRRGWEPLP